MVSWGYNGSGQTNVPPNLTNVVAVAGGERHSLALKEDGTLAAWGENTLGQCAIPAGATNVMAIAAGYQYSLALKNDGTMLAWGDNTYGQCNVPTNLHHVRLLAASAYHSLAAVFSPLVQYPVEVSKDLLLIYNTNSADSAFVKDYYLAYRPIVGEANMLGVGCTNAEIITSSTLTNEILNSYWAWLEANPTKRPQYLVLFPDIPSRVHDPATRPSVQVQLHEKTPGHAPFVTSINMATTNDCVAYIDKLAWCGSNFSPGQIILSAGKGGYGNTNFALDGVRHGGPMPHLEDYTAQAYIVSRVTNGLLSAGVSESAILFANGTEICINCATNIVGTQTNFWCAEVQVPSHLTNAINVAGYVSWGFHSALGSDYAITTGPNAVKWSGDSRWWIIQTIESNNGMRNSDSGNFLQWFSPNAFGGTNYSNTPVGAVTHTDEPFIPGINVSDVFFNRWASLRTFGVCAWESYRPPTGFPQVLQVIGDPLVTK